MRCLLESAVAGDGLEFPPRIRHGSGADIAGRTLEPVRLASHGAAVAVGDGSSSATRAARVWEVNIAQMRAKVSRFC